MQTLLFLGKIVGKLKLKKVSLLFKTDQRGKAFFTLSKELKSKQMYFVDPSVGR